MSGGSAHLVIRGSDTVRVLEIVISTQDLPRLFQRILGFASDEKTSEGRISELVLLSWKIQAK